MGTRTVPSNWTAIGAHVRDDLQNGGPPRPRETQDLNFRAILSLPVGYRLFQRLVGVHRLRVEYVAKYVRPKESDRVLDCGCGPGDFVTYLPQVDYVGIDMDEGYIASARANYGDRGSFRLGPVSAETMCDEAHYDLILANGLLHHLDDAQVSAFLRLATRNLKPSGRLVTFDGCYTENQSRIAKRLLDMDRGSHVRSLDAWLELVKPVFPAVQAHLRTDLLRIPYTHLVMECPAGG